MLTLTKTVKNCEPVYAVFPNNMLPEVALQVAGGGYTTKQTANAMQLRQQVEETGKGKLGNVTLTLDAAGLS